MQNRHFRSVPLAKRFKHYFRSKLGLTRPKAIVVIPIKKTLAKTFTKKKRVKVRSTPATTLQKKKKKKKKPLK